MLQGPLEALSIAKKKTSTRRKQAGQMNSDRYAELSTNAPVFNRTLVRHEKIDRCCRFICTIDFI